MTMLKVKWKQHELLLICVQWPKVISMQQWMMKKLSLKFIEVSDTKRHNMLENTQNIKQL